MKEKAFSIVELSIAIVIIGILVAGVVQSTSLISRIRLATAQSLTKSSDALTIKGIVLWMDSTAEEGFDVSESEDGANISNWYDINPQSNKATFSQATLANKPKYVANGMGGLPVISFDGNDSLSTSANVSLAYSGYTIFVVQSRLASSGMIFGASGGSGDGLSFGYNSDTQFRIAHVYNSGLHTWSPYTISGYSVPTPSIISIVNRASSASLGASSFYINGALSGSGAAMGLAGSGSNSYKIGVGGTYYIAAFYTGYIGEMIFYDRALKNEERQAVEKYLAKKWKIG